MALQGPMRAIILYVYSYIVRSCKYLITTAFSSPSHNRHNQIPRFNRSNLYAVDKVISFVSSDIMNIWTVAFEGFFKCNRYFETSCNRSRNCPYLIHVYLKTDIFCCIICISRNWLMHLLISTLFSIRLRSFCNE